MWKKLRNWFLRIFLAAVLLSHVQVLVYRWVNPPITLTMVQRLLQGRGMRQHQVPLASMSPHVPRAVIAAEDQKFVHHWGFDWASMRTAFRGNSQGKRLKGASTISQQTAKNVFLWQGRTYVRKVLEAYYTVLIELYWPKHRILEVYLNVIEMGPGVYGIDAAMKHHYGSSAARATRYQAAGIAAILPSPLRWKPQGRPAHVARKVRRILRDMPVVEMPYLPR